jgi:uridine kinase
MVTLESNFELVSPRPTVEIHLPDGRAISGRRGAAVGEFLQVYEDPQKAPVVGAIINGELRELTCPVPMDSKVRPVTMGEPDGMLIYRRSLTFLLDTAFEDLFPKATLTIDHSVASGGYFCQVCNRPSLTKDELKKLEARMRELVEADLPFERRVAPLSEAVKYFQKKNQTDKVRLLAHRRKNYLTLYRLGEHQDYHHGYMVPSTGYLRWFALEPTDGSFTLRFPRRHKPTELSPMPEYPLLLATFRIYGDWLERLDIASVGALNDSIQDGRIREVILVSEALHEQHVAKVASKICYGKSNGDPLRIILIAGPSSSGKTTFSKRLSIQLLAQGYSPFPLEMDNYFLNRADTPVNEDGEMDFESIHALDRLRLSHDLRRLIAGEKVRLPHFNFRTGVQEEGDVVQLQKNQIIILEGIHGLNPDLLPEINPNQTFRIHVSALTQLNLDHHNRISTTDTRLVRRTVRDARERGYTARDTISRWESVRRGEKANIFPYQEHADLMFNSALVYELASLKPLAEPLLRQVPHGTPEFVEAKRMLALLDWFLPLENDLVPDNSILREFIGGSILKEFKLWKDSSNGFGGIA